MQLVFIRWLWKRRTWKNLPTILHIAISLTVILQRLIPFSAIPLLPHFSYRRAKVEPSLLEPIWFKIWLYIDFYAYFFYLSASFAIYFHRLLFTYGWKARQIWLLVACAAFSLIGIVVSIEKSGIQKVYFEEHEGIRGQDSRYERFFTYICVIFPLGNLICMIFFTAKQHSVKGYRSLNSAALLALSVKYPDYRQKFPMLVNFYIEHIEAVHCVPAILIPVWVVFPTDKLREEQERD